MDTYRILWSYELTTLQKEVNELMDVARANWEPAGGICVVPTDDIHNPYRYIQAMTRRPAEAGPTYIGPR